MRKCVPYRLAKVGDAAMVQECALPVRLLGLTTASVGFWRSQRVASLRQLWTKNHLEVSSRRSGEPVRSRIPTAPSEGWRAMEQTRGWVYFAELLSDQEGLGIHEYRISTNSEKATNLVRRQ